MCPYFSSTTKKKIFIDHAMPEYAELHASAHEVNRHARDHTFRWVEVRDVCGSSEPRTLLQRAVPAVEALDDADVAALTRKVGSSGAGQRLLGALVGKTEVKGRRLKGTPKNFPLSALHRGKEVAVILGRPPDQCCKTCYAALQVENGVPKCGHGPMRDAKARKDNRAYFRCKNKQCDAFCWKDECPTNVVDDQEGAFVLTFRRGMRGRFALLDHEDDLEGAQVIFWRDDGKALAFLDHRVRKSDRAIWNVGGFTETRSPDPLWEPMAWRSKLSSFEDATFDHAICEVLLDQRYFNGVGNYLRAEILDLARIPPFDVARDVLTNPTTREALLTATTTTLRRAVLAHRSKRRLQLSVFRMRYAKRELDAHGRTIWFRRDRGSLPAPTVIESPWNRVAFRGIPSETPRSDVLAYFQSFGDLLGFWLSKGYGAARYKTVAQATAALQATTSMPLTFGRRLTVTYARRIRTNDPFNKDDDPPTSTDDDATSTSTKRKQTPGLLK